MRSLATGRHVVTNNIIASSDKAIDRPRSRRQPAAIHRDRLRDRPFDAGATATSRKRCVVRCQFLRGPWRPPEDGSTSAPRARSSIRIATPQRSMASPLPGASQCPPPRFESVRTAASSCLPSRTRAVLRRAPRCAARRNHAADLPCATPAPHRCACARKPRGDRALARRSLVLGGISAQPPCRRQRRRSPSAGWWEAQAGGRALDPRRIASSPSTGSAPTAALDAPIDHGRPGRRASPRCSTCSASIRLDAFVGCSYGAMVGLQFAARARRRACSTWSRSAARIARIRSPARGARCSAARSRWAQLQCDETPRPGAGAPAGDAELPHAGGIRRALRRARRSSTAACACAAEDYLDHCGAPYVARTSPTAFLRLSESIDLHARRSRARSRVPVTRGRGRRGPAGAARRRLRRWSQRLARRRRACSVLRSPYGHDAFLKEAERDRRGPARSALQDCVAERTGGLRMSRIRPQSAVPPPCAPASTATPPSAR